jgi:hypothetical protein
MGISSDVIRGCNDTIILCLLLDGPSYGYEISRRIRLMTEDAYIIKKPPSTQHSPVWKKQGALSHFRDLQKTANGAPITGSPNPGAATIVKNARNGT